MSATLEISRLPLARVAGAYFKFNAHPDHTANKLVAAQWLAHEVDVGRLNLTQIATAPLGSFGSFSAPAADPQLGKQVSDLASLLADATKRTDLYLNALNQTSANLQQDFASLAQETSAAAARQSQTDKRIERLTVAVDNIKLDDAAITTQVQQVIADAFAPFKQAVLDAGAESVVANLSGVRVIERRTATDVFGIPVRDIKGREILVDLWNHPESPDVDPDFIWTEPILRHLLLSQDTGENIWFGGEKGTGKSETARQFAAKTGRAFTRINFHKHTSAEEYIGAVGLKNGATVFEPKDFLLAYTCPSTVILLDEVTNADAGELAPLNGYLEPKAAVSFGGQVHRRAKGVLIFAADNTFGNGDESGRHAGTRVQNSALLDRFARVVQFQFLPAASEIEAICRHTGCTFDVADHVVQAITVCRAKVESGDIVDAPSIRSAMAFIRALNILPANEAWQTAVVSRQPSESAAVLNAIFATSINADFLSNNL